MTTSSPPTMQELRERRSELDVSLKGIGKELATSDDYQLAASTLSTRVSEWERSATGAEDDDEELASATENDRETIAVILDEIEARRNQSHPPCTACPREPVFPPDYIDGDPYCIVCGYTRGERGGVPRAI